VTTRDEYLSWIRAIADAPSFGVRDRLGTVNHVDEAARRRAASVITTGRAVSLARPLREGESMRHDDLPAYRLQVFRSDGPDYLGIPVAFQSDHVEFDCHGGGNTHVDALNHISLDAGWYAGWMASDGDGPSVDHLAVAGIVTRAIYVDVPGQRGAPWIDPASPVTSDDLETGCREAGVELTPGDALLLDMGKDRFDAGGGTVASGVRPGVGSDAARWIAERKVSVLCWDFLDAAAPGEPPMPVHLLNWAIGLVLVDNCDFGAMRATSGRPAVGALMLAPLRLEGATGSNVNPLFVF
jgi:kynurenine formamidase